MSFEILSCLRVTERAAELGCHDAGLLLLPANFGTLAPGEEFHFAGEATTVMKLLQAACVQVVKLNDLPGGDEYISMSENEQEGSLNPSRENIKRARRKVDSLKAAIDDFVQSKPITVRFHPDGDWVHVIACREKDVPEDLAFETVEIVGRLRAALDKAVVAVVSKNGRGAANVGFPFGGVDRDTWEGRPFPEERMTSLIKKFTTAQWDFILAQRPYPHGNDALWAINEIANTDKHRSDLVTVRPAFSHRFGPGAMANRGEAYRLIMQPGPTQTDHIIADKDRETIMFSTSHATRIAIEQQNMEHQLSFSLVFGPIVPVAGANVLSVLNDQIEKTQQVIDGLAQFM